MINPDGIYYEIYNIKEYECDCKGLLKVSQMLRLMQQTSSAQLEQLGIGYKKLLAENMVFLMSALEITINKRPSYMENITVSTCPLESKGARFFRYNSFSAENGEILAEAVTSWLLVNPNSRKIYRPNQFPYTLVTGKLEDDSFIKLRMPKLEQYSTRKVVYSDIDVNGHINNARYADIALDCIPYGVVKNNEVKSLNLQFKQECMPGENMELGIDNSTQRVYYIGGSCNNTERFGARVVF